MLKITPWENSEKDVTCLLDCKIGLRWHVVVCAQLPNSSSFIDDVIRPSRCPSGVYNIIKIQRCLCRNYCMS